MSGDGGGSRGTQADQVTWLEWLTAAASAVAVVGAVGWVGKRLWAFVGSQLAKRSRRRAEARATAEDYARIFPDGPPSN